VTRGWRGANTNQKKSFDRFVAGAGHRVSTSVPTADGAGRMEAVAAVRFVRTSPPSRDQFREQVLRHVDSICPGLTILANHLAVPGRGAIDILASDERGRLVLISSALRVTPAGVARALGQWDWLLRNLEVLRGLAPFGACDITREPRLVLAGSGVSAAARRLAGYLGRPEIEMLRVSVLRAGDEEGVLVDRIAPAALASAPESRSADPLLGGFPAGEARSAARRLIERVRGAGAPGVELELARLDGGLDIRKDDRVIATLVVDDGTLLVRQAAGQVESAVTTEEECEEAARWIAGLASGAEGESPGGSGPGSSRPERTAPMAALTDEEIAEFEKLADEKAPEAPATAPSRETGPAVTGFVEN